MSFCPFRKYKDIFGKVGKGGHKYRLLNTPMVDYVLTIIAAFIITYFTNIPLVLTTVVLFILGFACHLLFGVETTLIKYLGIKC